MKTLGQKRIINDLPTALSPNTNTLNFYIYKWNCYNFLTYLLMSLHKQSNTLHMIDFLATTGSRSFTPVLNKLRRVHLPSITDENNSPHFQMRPDKKYSILAVPKTTKMASDIFKDLNIPRELETEERSNEIDTCSSNDKFVKCKSDKNSFAKLCNMKKCYRSFKNPNEEALKAELAKIESQKSTIGAKRSSAPEPEAVKFKSDIEILLESQEFVRNKKIVRRDTWRKQDLCLNLCNIIETPKEAYESSSRASDPSPVKEVLTHVSYPISQTPTVKSRISKKTVASINSLSESKTGKEILEKMQFDKKKSHRGLFRESPKIDYSSKIAFDYQQESLKILKNTAFMAEKIMKGIRCGARVKSIYL